MIKDPRHYTQEFPQSNVLIKQALCVLGNQANFSELTTLMANVLKNENDALINVALNLSPSFAVSNIIWKALNAAINDMSDISAHIFAIPLVLVAGSKARSSIAANLDVNNLNEYFNQSQIFPPETDCFISGKLIDPVSLAKIKPSQLYYWGRNLKNAKLWLPISVEGTPIDVLNEGVFLRFLIGLTITNDKLGINHEAYRDAAMGLMKIINKELHNDAVTLFPIPFPPVFLSEAYPVGDSKRIEIAISVALSNIVRKIREKNLIPIAVLDSDNEALRVSVRSLDSSEFSETSLWHLNKFDDYHEHLDTIVNLLTDMQVDFNYVR